MGAFIEALGELERKAAETFEGSSRPTEASPPPPKKATTPGRRRVIDPASPVSAR